MMDTFLHFNSFFDVVNDKCNSTVMKSIRTLNYFIYTLNLSYEVKWLRGLCTPKIASCSNNKDFFSF